MKNRPETYPLLNAIWQKKSLKLCLVSYNLIINLAVNNSFENSFIKIIFPFNGYFFMIQVGCFKAANRRVSHFTKRWSIFNGDFFSPSEYSPSFVKGLIYRRSDLRQQIGGSPTSQKDGPFSMEIFFPFRIFTFFCEGAHL